MTPFFAVAFWKDPFGNERVTMNNDGKILAFTIRSLPLSFT